MTHRWEVRAPRVTGLVSPVPVDPTGEAGPTRGQAPGPHWRRTTRGLYVAAEVSEDRVEQRILEQAQRITASGAVTGWAALRLHGAGFFDGVGVDGRTRLPVPIAAGGDRLESHPAILRTREQLGAGEVVVRHGIRCTTVARALIDEVRRLDDLREAVVALDMTCAAELTSLRRLATTLDAYAGVRGRGRTVALVRAALPLADEGSRSPQESRLRLVWELDAGWPHPLCNRPVYDAGGRLLGIPDLLDPELGVVGEYDGADHRERKRHEVDVRREADFRRVGLELVTVVGSMLRDKDVVVARMVEARARAGRVPATWVLDPPGRRPPLTLDERLDRLDRRPPRRA